MTKFQTKKSTFFNYFYIFSILFIICQMVITPMTAISAFGQGVIIWATKILPALLPFFVLTTLLSYTTFTSTVGKWLSPITNKLYGVGGVAGYVYLMSIMSGYPVGAKLTADLYRKDIITSPQAISISAFTSTSGPLFVIGTVGVGFFGSQKIGIIVLITHLLGALINGVFYRQKCNSNTHILGVKPITRNVLNDSMASSIASIMTVGGFIAIFYMILQLLLSLGIFNLPALLFAKVGISPDITIGIMSGLIEVTSGALALSQCHIGTDLAIILLSFLVSFGGISIHAQAYCFLKDFDMPYYKFLLQKFTHALISATLAVVFVLVF